MPFGVLNLSKRLSVRISFFIFYAIFTLLVIFFGFNVVLVIAVPIMILSILILRRKGYFTNFTKARVAMAGACLLVFTWQLEVPQTIIVNLLPKKLEIVDTNFTYLENPKNFGRKEPHADEKSTTSVAKKHKAKDSFLSFRGAEAKGHSAF